jgi:hypothetical protein
LPETAPEADAIRHIGTNALPWLLKWIRYESPAWKHKLIDISKRLPQQLGDSFIFEPLRRNDLDHAAHQQAILDCFHFLGSSAMPAVTELSRLAADSKSSEVSGSAIAALAYVGKDALPELVGILTNKQATFRYLAAFWIVWQAHQGTDVTCAVPALGKCVQDQDENVAVFAASALGGLQVEPTLALPYLIHGLKDSRINVRYLSATDLARLGPNATSAIPALVAVLGDPFLRVRKAATNALLKISPESLPKSGQEN